MRWTGRISVVAALAGLALALFAQGALGAFGIAKWEAGTCTNSECTKSTPEDFYTKAAGHPPFGITDFALKTNPTTGAPEGKISDVRVDIPAGLSVNPLATPQCKPTGLGLVGCPLGARVGEARLKVHVLSLIPVEIKATVYNVEPPPGVPLEADFEPAPGEIVHIVGGIDWSGDYHEFFTIKVPSGLAELVESRLIFFGTEISGGTLPFITMPSPCSGPQTTYLKVVDSSEKTEDTKSFTTGPPDLTEPIGVTECSKVPFEPGIAVRPATTQSDRPDGATVEVKVPQNPDPKGFDSSTLKDASVSLPEGLTLNPAAASGLGGCSDAQFHKGSEQAIECPVGSVIGTDTIETPDLPPGSLTGDVYVGQPLSNNPESGQEYRVFIAAQSARYGVGVRLIGNVSANAATGRLTTLVVENPQVPFSDFILNFNSAHNPLANPLACGPATTNAIFVPYSGNPPALPSEAFAVDFDGKGGACPSPLPFGVGQSTAIAPTAAGAASTFSYNIVRPEGQQYISKLTTTIPAGLVASISAINPLCGEPQAAAGECPASSEIGTTTVTVGSGEHPYALSGRVYLTGPYAGQPFGLSIVVPAEKVGPYDFGRIVTRAAIGVDPYTANVSISSQLPTVVGGAPVRLRTLSVDVNRPGFTFNPTSCAPLTVQTALISTFGTAGSASSAVQASGCSALGFHPSFSARTRKKTSRASGAELIVRLRIPKSSRANIKSVFTRLPKQLPARISTLNLACREAVFAANPFGCPSTAQVGTVVVHTPVLPVPLRGSAILVSHGGAAFPDFDFVISGDGVTMVLVGHTNIVKNITSSDFASVPDVPVSSVEVRLPMGPKSALGANGSLCARPLFMPTVLTAQNGKVLKQKTRILVAGCPHKHKRHKHRRRGHGHGRKHGHGH